MIQIQLRVPKEIVKHIDKLIAKGKFESRSEAVRAMISFYEEREKTQQFLNMLLKRSKESENKPHILIPFKELE